MILGTQLGFVLLSLVHYSSIHVAHGFGPASYLGPRLVQQQRLTIQSQGLSRVTAITTTHASTKSSVNEGGSPFGILRGKVDSLLPVVKSAVLYITLDLALAKAFARHSIAFPSALAGMVGLFGVLIGLDTFKGAEASGAAMALLAPGAALFAKWLPLFFVPSLVVLPLFPPPGGLDALKLVVLLLVGWAASVASTAKLVETLASLVGAGEKTPDSSSSQKKDGGGVKKTPSASYWPPSGASAANNLARLQRLTAPAAAAATPPRLFSAALRNGLAVAAAGAGAATVVLARTASAPANGAAQGLAQPCLRALSAVFALSSSALAFVLGSSAAPKVKAVLHPVLVTTGATWGALALLAALAGARGGAGPAGLSFLGLLKGYITRQLTVGSMGAGDVLLFLLGPSILSFSVEMFRQRKVMAERRVEVAGVALGASLSGLFGTAALARLLCLGPSLRLPCVSRQLTSPLAMAVADLLGAERSLAVALVVITGLLGSNFGRALMDALGYHNPVTRGLTMGASAHGLGTAALAATEPGAFAFAAVAMALVGTTTTALVSVPAVRAALKAVAGV
mmetsp:Transcript_21179/g.41961  ORF Transcript_21179/g.41961 Transcript_21179/m.41961 type:complete len:568 (+) Transcript_21179:146-1849(+)|eukprot:CAMPEP_0171991558 /NCGR_PEP_ID=MMETSP0993-20121228/277490_1 /TAXON_ID=483369 /ORGANISM="non described non described, Strain CCMP2098" /LENGTH=567 /DNA_ID=CAMNT_0012644585 /DNA_START=72 /DNA_END=1775 /DNA_ORIENTATION=-